MFFLSKPFNINFIACNSQSVEQFVKDVFYTSAFVSESRESFIFVRCHGRRFVPKLKKKSDLKAMIGIHFYVKTFLHHILFISVLLIWFTKSTLFLFTLMQKSPRALSLYIVVWYQRPSRCHQFRTRYSCWWQLFNSVLEASPIAPTGSFFVKWASISG